MIKVTDEMVFAGAVALHPELFSTIPYEAHRAASPFNVEAARQKVLETSRKVLEAALSVPAQEAETLWTKAGSEHAKLGWTYDFDHIVKVRDEASDLANYDATLEFTEAMMKIADERLSAPAQAPEPVAWRWKWKTTGSALEQRFADPDLYMWSYRDSEPTGDAANKMDIEPLYLHPALETRPAAFEVLDHVHGTYVTRSEEAARKTEFPYNGLYRRQGAIEP